MKPYSLDLREKIISTYEAGNTSIRQVAKRFQVSKNTVQSLLKRKQATRTLKPAPASGGKINRFLGFRGLHSAGFIAYCQREQSQRLCYGGTGKRKSLEESSQSFR